MKKYSLLLLCGWLTLSAYTQNTWVKKATFLGNKRERAVGFSIDSLGYLATGEDTADQVHKDLWCYSPATDTWTQKADLPGDARRNAVAFVVNGKAYVATGMNASESFAGDELNDMWEYNPVTNGWTQKANYPGGGGAGVYFAASFAIHDKGYICCGKIGPSWYAQDLWEYKPATDTWLQRANFPGGVRYQLSGIGVGQRGYVGLGTDENAYTRDWYEFNPATNTWTQKADLPGVQRGSASTFTVYGRAFVLFGSDGGFLEDIWEFDPLANSWMVRAPFPGGDRRNAIAFAIDGVGYTGTGKGTSGKRRNFYAYYPIIPASISENSLNESPMIYPNPIHDHVTIELPREWNARVYRITDLQGRLVKEGNISSTTERINELQDLHGTYVLIISDEKGTTLCTQKILAL